MGEKMIPETEHDDEGAGDGEERRRTWAGLREQEEQRQESQASAAIFENREEAQTRDAMQNWCSIRDEKRKTRTKLFTRGNGKSTSTSVITKIKH